MKHRYGFVILSCLLMLAFAVPAVAQSSTVWTAEYFNNANLSGSPVFTQLETSPNHDWSVGSPSPAVPVDNFSVRWTSVQMTPAVPNATYQLTVRADDGVRVSIDGILYINQWHLASGSSYNATLTLAPGAHTFVVEYYEATQLAYLQYSFALITAPPPTSSSATIATGMLNVRDKPNPFTGTVLIRVRNGEVYPVVGKNADSSWIQINVNGITGWVNVTYTSTTNLQLVPITDSSTRPSGITVTATVTANFLNVRQTPDPINGLILARISLGQTYNVTGRTADSSWVQLNINGVLGWVNRIYVYVPNVQSAPVVGSGTTMGMATVTANMLNVRAVPDPINGLIIARITLGQTYPAVGRNAAGTWVQLSLTNFGLVGWVNAHYVNIVNLPALPVTG